MSANNSKTAPVTLTRPSNTTPYAAGQVVNNNASSSALRFNFNVLNNANIWITGGECISSNPSATRNLILMLFSSEPDVAADGSAFNPTLVQMQNNYLGSIAFSTFTALAANSYGDGATSSGKPIIGTPDGQVIYGVLIAAGAWTPISQEQITIKLDYQTVDNT